MAKYVRSNVHFYMQAKTVQAAIRRAKKLLINRINSRGLYADFGEEEVENIYNKFVSDEKNEVYLQNIIIPQINGFQKWCINIIDTKESMLA